MVTTWQQLLNALLHFLISLHIDEQTVEYLMLGWYALFWIRGMRRQRRRDQYRRRRT